MSATAPRLIVVDDDEIIRNLLKIHAKKSGLSICEAANGEEALASLTDETEVILLDLNMPVMDGFTCLEELKKRDPTIATIVLSAADEITDAVRAMKLGAVDYLTKPFDPDELLAVISKASHLCRTERENATLREAFSDPTPGAKTDIVSGSPAMDRILAQARKVAAIDTTVLLTGDSGVGKGMLARYIHAHSDRADAPFVTISCPTLPSQLLESELFGHEKGAFTGAVKKRVGKMEAAKGGTVFLDEIGELPIELQPKLLNVLQDREFQRLGGEKFIKADVRIIAATNIDFEEKIAAGEFREDLYYRLNVVPIEIPSLRERIDSVPELAKNCLKRLAKQRKTPVVKISPEAMSLLKSYHWPGNVRQLENILERTSIFCSDETIRPEDLPGEFHEPVKSEIQIGGLAGIPLATIERQAFTQTFDACNGNRAETARQLGITEKSVYNKLKRYNLT